MSYSHNRLNLTPGSLYVDKLAVRHILPVDQQNNEYSTNTIFAVAVNGELQGYDPATWFSSIGYTDPSTIQGELISTIDVLNTADRSTVAGLGSAGYVSLATLNSTLQSTVAGLTAYTPVSLDLFYNTINGLANTPYNYVSSTQLQSTVAGLGSAGYVSTIDGLLSVSAISTGAVTTSTVKFRDILGGGAEKTLYNQGGNLYFDGQSLAGSLDLSLNTLTAAISVRAPLLSTLTINAQNTGAPRQWAVAGAGASAGSVAYSTDNGATWGAPTAVFASGTINKILYIAGRWYALGQSGSEYGLKYSADGITWTPTNIFTATNGYAIAYNGSYYLAGGDNGGSPSVPYISNDGITWTSTATPNPFAFSITDILYTGSRWIAVGNDNPSGSAFIKWSIDGFTWNNGIDAITSASLGPGSATSIATNGHTIVVGMSNGSAPSIYYSTDDGLSWTAASNTFTNNASQIIWNTSYYIAVGNTGSYIKYSRDGRTWLDAQYSGGAAVVSVFWNGRTHRAITAANTVYQSTDGIIWTTAATPSPFGTNSYITYSVDGRDTLIAPNVTLYGVDVPHYYNSTSQIYAAPDKLILNDTLTVRGGLTPTVGIMKGDPSAAYHLDVDGAINASTIYVSSLQVNDLADAGSRNTIDFSNGQFRVNGVAAFQSTVIGLGSAGYVSTISLQSTLAGLGSAGYISTPSLQSTVAGLGQTYVSTDTLTNTIQNLGQTYVSTPSLQSTVAGLGSAGYVSTQTFNASLQSTVAGLGQRYVSTETLDQRFTQAVVSTLRLTTQTNRNTPYSVDLNNTTAFPTTSSIVRVKDSFNTTIISDYTPQIIVQGYNNGPTDYKGGLGIITDGNRAQLAFNQSTFIEFYNEKFGMNKTFPAATLDISGNLNVTGSITGSSLNGSVAFTILSVQDLITSTITANSDVSIDGSITVGGTQNTTWYPQRWICGAPTESNTGTIHYSDNNGVSWSAVPSSTAIFSTRGGKAVWNGNIWVMTGEGTASRLAYSVDGLNWADVSGGSLNLFSHTTRYVEYNGRIWVACGKGNGVTDNSGAICYSVDGITWTRCTGVGALSAGSTDPAVNCLKWNGYMWLAGLNTGAGSGGTAGLANRALLYSYDGITWAAVPNSTNLFNQYCSTIEWNGFIWLIGGYDDRTIGSRNSMYYSYDGFNWTGLGTTPFGQFCRDIKWNGRMFVGIGYNSSLSTNVIAYSYDGFNWTGLGTSFFSATASNRADRIGWNGKKWLIGGYGPRNQTMITSTDGITWTAVTNDISGTSFAPSYSVDIEPDLAMTNMSIYSQAVPNYLTSSNQILVGASTITLNNIITVNKDSKDTTIRGGVNLFTSTLYVGNANLSTNTIRFYGTNLDGPGQGVGPYSHTVIAERVYEAAENSELLFFKGNDAQPNFNDRIRHLAAAHQFDITQHASVWTDVSGNPPNAKISGALYIDNTGNVGVQTTTPTATLDVSGTFKSRLNFVDVATAGFTIGPTHYGSYVAVTGAGTITFPSSAPEGVVVVLINDSGSDRTLSVPGTFKGNNSTTLTVNTTRTLAFHGSSWYGL